MLELCLTASMVKLKSRGHLDGALAVDRAIRSTVLKNPFQSPVKVFEGWIEGGGVAEFNIC